MIATSEDGIPVGWVVAAANTNDCKLLAATVDDVAVRGLLFESAPSAWTAATTSPSSKRRSMTARSTTSSRPVDLGQVRQAQEAPIVLGPRWPVERTNAWLINFGQLRRNTDRKLAHRLAQLALAVVSSSPPSPSTGATGGRQDASLSAEPLSGAMQILQVTRVRGQAPSVPGAYAGRQNGEGIEARVNVKCDLASGARLGSDADHIS